MLKLNVILACCTLSIGCAAHKPVKQPVPQVTPVANKPKPRPIVPGDYVLKMPDGSTVVCHRPIQVIDSTKRQEDVTVYRCR